MLLIKDKYAPRSLSGYRINTHLKHYRNMFTKDNFCNTIVYGPEGAGKYNFLLCALNELYGEKIYKKRKTTIKYTSNSGIKDFEIESSNYHYEIYLNDYILNNKTSLINIIKEICKTKNVSTDFYKIILIKNGDFISKENYSIFKTITETYYQTCKFIITFNSISECSPFLKGLFSFIRIPLAKENDIISFLKDVSFKEGINARDEDLKEIVVKSRRNLNKLMNIYELSYINKEYNRYEDNLEKELNKIIKLINTCKCEKIIEIRKLIYDLMSKNIIKNNIIKYILRYYLNKDYTNDIKQKIVSSAAKYQSRTINGYRSIIHVEAWCVYIMKILIELNEN